MVKSLKVHEKPAFKSKFFPVRANLSTYFADSIPESILPLKAKATAHDREVLEMHKKALNGRGVLKYGWDEHKTQAWGLYFGGEEISYQLYSSRDEARAEQRHMLKVADIKTTLHRVTVIRGDRVR